jgi:hypothetical protein
VLILVFFRSQGDADCPRPHACQGAQVGRARDNEAAIGEGTGEPPRSTAMATGPQQEETAGAATAVTAVTSASPTLVPAAGDCAAVVDVTDDGAPPPGWGQWGTRPASATKLATEVLVMQEDGCVISQRSAHNTEASTSRAALPASDVSVAHPEQGGVMSARRRPISTRPRPSWRHGRSFGTMAPRLTMC